LQSFDGKNLEDRPTTLIYVRTKFGKTVSSSLFKLSDSLWLHEVRDNIRNLVEYIEHNDSYDMPKKLDSEQFQSKVFGKVIRGGLVLGKLKQAAVAIARIKNEYPYMIKQLKDSGDKIFNTHAVHVIFF